MASVRRLGRDTTAGSEKWRVGRAAAGFAVDAWLKVKLMDLCEREGA